MRPRHPCRADRGPTKGPRPCQAWSVCFGGSRCVLSDRCCRQLRDHGHWWIRQEYKYDYLGKVWEVFGANEGELKQFGRIGSPSTALKIPVGMVR